MTQEEFWDFTHSEIISLCEFRQDQRMLPAAQICAVIANVYRDREKQKDPFQPADFLPSAERKESSGMTEEQAKLTAKAWGAVFGANLGELNGH